ncbi:hypothetical protein [Candidatus Poriferisocius sp.]|uniref:hypothetical protein n=1 Tax=Candidatus Poriferisocius sp. TaxID=3101276 RepID=UPI003B01FD0F
MKTDKLDHVGIAECQCSSLSEGIVVYGATAVKDGLPQGHPCLFLVKWAKPGSSAALKEGHIGIGQMCVLNEWQCSRSKGYRPLTTASDDLNSGRDVAHIVSVHIVQLVIAPICFFVLIRLFALIR